MRRIPANRDIKGRGKANGTNAGGDIDGEFRVDFIQLSQSWHEPVHGECGQALDG